MGRVKVRAALTAAVSGATLALACAAAFNGGCTMGPNYHSPALHAPEAFAGPLPGTAAPTSRPTTGIATTRPIDLTTWWTSFDDPTLNSLVGRALEGSLDLQLAVARLQEARELEAATLGGN